MKSTEIAEVDRRVETADETCVRALGPPQLTIKVTAVTDKHSAGIMLLRKQNESRAL